MTTFIVTKAGLGKALDAEAKGLKIVLQSFKLATGYGYVPVETQTGFVGTVVYSANIDTYKKLDDKTKLCTCSIAPAAGPFTYGELGLFLDDGTLFAICVLDTPLTKLSSLDAGVSSNAVFNCVFTMDKGSASITIDYTKTSGTEIVDTSKWTDLVEPSQMSLAEISENMVIHELVDTNQSNVYRDYTNDEWFISNNWSYFGSPSIVSKTTTELVVPLKQTLVGDKTMLDTAAKHWLVQAGTMFRVATAVAEGDNIKYTWADAMTIGTSVKLWGFTQYQIPKIIDYINGPTSTVPHKGGDETITGNWTFDGDTVFNGTCTFDKVIRGTALNALWADLAEVYEADRPYKPGTLVAFGGSKEITAAREVANGVVSTHPAYLMNSKAKGLPVALAGRVPVLVKGKVKKFDRIGLSPDMAGVGVVVEGAALAIALKDKPTEELGLVECVTRFRF